MAHKKLERYHCGNGDGMFEDSKGEYITFKDHQEIIEQMKASRGIICDEIDRQIQLAQMINREPKIIMISGPGVKMFEDEINQLAGFNSQGDVRYEPTHYKGIRLSLDENEMGALRNGSVPPIVMVGTNNGQ